MHLNLQCPRTNKTLSSVLTLDILVTDKFGYLSESEQVYLEFERWDSIKGWGKRGLFASDPPPFCTVDGSFGSTNEIGIAQHLDETLLPYHVPVRSWTTTEHRKFEGSETWMYRATSHVTDFRGWDWHATKFKGCNVRRRIWHRTTRLDHGLIAEKGRSLLCSGL